MHGMLKIIFSPFQGMKGALYYLRLCLANFRDNRYKFDTLVLLPTIQKVKLVLKWVANIRKILKLIQGDLLYTKISVLKISSLILSLSESEETKISSHMALRRHVAFFSKVFRQNCIMGKT